MFMAAVAGGYTLTSERCADIVRKASRKYVEASNQSTWPGGLLDIQEALGIAGVDLEIDGIPVQGAIPPTDKSMVTTADLLKFHLHLPIAFSLGMVRSVVDAAVLAREVHLHAINIGLHYISMVVDGRNGSGHCVVRIIWQHYTLQIE
jgi:hypothetical protein